MATAARALSKAMWDTFEIESDRFVSRPRSTRSWPGRTRILEIPIVFRPRTKFEGKKVEMDRTDRRRQDSVPIPDVEASDGASGAVAPPPLSVYPGRFGGSLRGPRSRHRSSKVASADHVGASDGWSRPVLCSNRLATLYVAPVPRIECQRGRYTQGWPACHACPRYPIPLVISAVRTRMP